MAKDTPQARPVKAEPAMKICYGCATYVYNAVRLCHECGFEFYPNKIKGMRHFNTTYGKERRPAK